MIKYGFNMDWMFRYWERPEPEPVKEKQLDFIAKHGFNYIRLPVDYQFWTKDFDYFHPNEAVIENIDKYLNACRQRNLHMCLNLHRAPGYCVNNMEKEKHNLWVDEIAQEGFIFIWEYFAKRYKGISSSELSFNLLNEPVAPGIMVKDHEFSRDDYERLMRRTIKAVRDIDKDREIVLDGVTWGWQAIPELADTNTVHSCRGYLPTEFSHYRLDPNKHYDPPAYPTKEWNRDVLLNEHYAEWIDVAKKGVEVHIGEFGCFNQTPNDLALKWFSDLLSIYRENGWGYALWSFDRAFGLVGHGRPGTVYTNMDGFEVDKALLDLMKENMVK